LSKLIRDWCWDVGRQWCNVANPGIWVIKRVYGLPER